MEAASSDLTEPRKPLWFLLWLVPLLAQGVASLVLVVKSLFPYWQDRWIQDDAYISFRFAKHLFEGHGLVYNIGEPVEGYTNFLWTLLSVIPIALGQDDPIHFMHTLSLALWIGSYFVLLLLGVRLYREGNWAAPLALIPLTYHWSYNMWFFSGMETPLVSFLSILPVFFFSFDPEKHPTALLWTSLSAVGLMLTRPDGVVVFPALSIVGLAFYWRPLFVERKWVRYLLMPAAPILLVFLPYTIWRVSFYGSFYPNTYYAKVAYLTFYERGWVYLTGYLEVFKFARFLPVAILGAVLSGRSASGRFLWASLSFSAFVFWYVVRLGGDFMEWRFVTPVTGVLYPAIIVGAGVIGQRIVDFPLAIAARFLHVTFQGVVAVAFRAASGLLGGVSSIVALYFLTQTTIQSIPAAKETLVPGQETIALLRRYCDPNQYNWKSAAKVFDEVLPKDVKIATTSAGIIPFYCDRPCLDLHGLTDPVIARQPVDPNNRGRMGHEHWLQDYGEMRRRGVDIYLFWVDPKPFAKSLATPPHDNMEMVSMKLPDNRYTEFFVLNSSKVKVEELRQDPRLVFYDSAKISARASLYALKQRYQDYQVIAEIDLENRESQRVSAFREIIPPNAPYGHNFHTKILPYGGNLKSTVIEDDGLRLYGEAEWVVRNLAPGKDLVLILRFDHTGSSSYSIETNGQRVPGSLTFPPGAEVWDESSIEIPARFLKEGENTFRLIRDPASPSDAELYYLWILQPK